MFRIEFTGQFKRDYKKALKKGLNVKLLEQTIRFLAEGSNLPKKYRDHTLINSKNYKNMRECHIEPDWLLVYQILEDILVLRLIRTGSHSELF